MVATKLDKLLFYRVKDRAEGIDGGLERRVRLVELDGLFGSHDGVETDACEVEILVNRGSALDISLQRLSQQGQ